MSTTEDDTRGVRRKRILEKLAQISKQQNIPQEKDIKSLQKLVENAVKDVERLGKGLDEQRAARNIFSKSGNALQKFASSFSKFLKAYSGISELSKGVDSQYGGMVVGALSLLFQIGENKEGRETAINSAFKELTGPWIGNMGRLKQYSEALPDSRKMEELIADVYLGIGELAVDSQKYYLRPSHARFWQAIRRPPMLDIGEKVSEIKRALYEVVLEGNAELVRSHFEYVEAEKKKSQYLVNESVLTSRYREQQRKDKINHIERGLGIDRDTASPEKLIKKCKSLHTDAFTEAIRPSPKRNKTLQQISLEFVKDFGFYKPWYEATDSSVLILSGSNFDGYESGKNLCWLSPITTEFAETQLSSQVPGKKSQILFFSACHDEASRYGKKKGRLDDCFSHFISQMLHWDTEIVEKYCQSVEDDVRDMTRQKKDTLKRFLEACIHFNQVYIIIDRLDCFAPLDDDDELDNETVSGILEVVLDTVGTASCNVKLMITIDAAQWSDVKTDAQMERRWKNWKRQLGLKHHSMFCKIGWTQPELENW